MEVLVRGVHRLVVPVEHDVVQYAVRLGVQPGGDREVIDERLGGEHRTHVRRRGGRVPEPDQVGRQVGPEVVDAEPVERQDQQERMSRDRDRGCGAQREARDRGMQQHRGYRGPR